MFTPFSTVVVVVEVVVVVITKGTRRTNINIQETLQKE